ncbi:Peptidylprolyl isomerase [Mycena kentingensis (nom. inval.)]|nr:Peptidylprolyl isomerase [Mycena kentingensis (nom. inval.)]
MDAPHTHPRATELLISVNSTLRTGMITENGARIVVEGLQPDDNMTVFPLGILCLPLDVVGATFGDLGVLEVAELASSIPDSFSLGTSECLRRCGLQRNRGGKPQPTAQQQPRISGNAFPSGVLQSASRAPSASKSDAPVADPSPGMVALLVINGVLLLALIGCAVVYFRSRETRGQRQQYMSTGVRVADRSREKDDNGTEVPLTHVPPARFDLSPRGSRPHPSHLPPLPVVSVLVQMGVNIEVLTPGDGKSFPKPGDTVTIHYVGTLTDGSKFDSSRDRGEPWKTQIGVGKVIKGWDEGVPKLSVGSKAILTVSADYGYGARGFPPVIPPNSVLKFEVELIKIN